MLVDVEEYKYVLMIDDEMMMVLFNF